MSLVGGSLPSRPRQSTKRVVQGGCTMDGAPGAGGERTAHRESATYLPTSSWRERGNEGGRELAGCWLDWGGLEALFALEPRSGTAERKQKSRPAPLKLPLGCRRRATRRRAYLSGFCYVLLENCPLPAWVCIRALEYGILPLPTQIHTTFPFKDLSRMAGRSTTVALCHRVVASWRKLSVDLRQRWQAMIVSGRTKGRVQVRGARMRPIHFTLALHCTWLQQTPGLEDQTPKDGSPASQIVGYHHQGMYISFPLPTYVGQVWSYTITTMAVSVWVHRAIHPAHSLRQHRYLPPKSATHWQLI